MLQFRCGPRTSPSIRKWWDSWWAGIPLLATLAVSAVAGFHGFLGLIDVLGVTDPDAAPDELSVLEIMGIFVIGVVATFSVAVAFAPESSAASAHQHPVEMRLDTALREITEWLGPFAGVSTFGLTLGALYSLLGEGGARAAVSAATMASVSCVWLLGTAYRLWRNRTQMKRHKLANPQCAISPDPRRGDVALGLLILLLAVSSIGIFVAGLLTG